jgi:LacI family transcriptional regulator|uniref:LacI family DNA-binding transcriptional regulator n=1 Tax=Eubacterium cellulosolvens TaxID=29322 RepID=UPI00048827C6|nr:LacI family DNA-binding transcriptional regulator [[Eubacterium] cellulosolvens]
MAALTIKDIARICNVSISTVSRAINNDPTINAKTRERVMEVVREFNYIPNNSARNLKMTESNTVALIVKGINNPFFQGMFPYFQKRLEDLGYQYLLHTVGGDADEGYVAEAIAKEKRLKGIIFLGGKMNYPEKILENIRIPMVLCSVAGLSHEDNVLPRVSTVSIDDSGEAHKVVEYLIRKGHRRIAIITGQKDDLTVGRLRLRGYRKALEENGIAFDEKLVGYMDDGIPEFTEANGYATMKRMLESGTEFTAAFVISDRMAMGAYKALYDAGKRIPEDCSVIGFDGIEMTRYMQPSLTTVKQPVEELVESSVQMLMKQINGSRERKHLIYDAELLERDSVKFISNS